MPNIGRPSKDCHLCRSRRVKCDLGRPACQRCIKYGAECPGYRDEHELVFRNENPGAMKKRRKRAQQTSRESSVTSSSLTAKGSTPSVAEALTPPTSSSEESTDLAPLLDAGHNTQSLPQSLSEHWTAHSVPILLNVYSTLEFLHSTYRQNAYDGPLVWAAHLFSRTYVTNLRHPTAIDKRSVTNTETELGIYLGKTLSSVNMALKSPDGFMRDDVLATVWILANYELLVGTINRIEPLSPWHLHARGLYSILKSRGSLSLLTEGGRAGFWPAYNMVQIQCLVMNSECPPESNEWLRIIEETQDLSEGLSLTVSIFIVKVAHVQCRMTEIMNAGDFEAASAEYRELLQVMSQAEDKMQAFYDENSHRYHDLDCYMRNLYCSARVKGYHIMLSFANFLTHHAACPISSRELMDFRANCARIVRSAAQEILDTLDQNLNRSAFRKDPSPKTLFDALKLIWPLSAISVIPSTLLGQKQAAKEALQFIGREFGIRQALRVYNGSRLLPVEAQKPLELVGEVFESSPTDGIQ